MGAINEFKGVAIETTFLEDHQLCRVQVDSESVVVKTVGQHKTDCSGKQVHIHFPKEEILVFPTP